MSLDGVKEPQYLEKTNAGTGRAKQTPHSKALAHGPDSANQCTMQNSDKPNTRYLPSTKLQKNKVCGQLVNTVKHLAATLLFNSGKANCTVSAAPKGT